MATNFRQYTATGGEYLWSNVANWTSGIPTDGGAVTFDVTGRQRVHPTPETLPCGRP
jgi:hypothetical protein